MHSYIHRNTHIYYHDIDIDMKKEMSQGMESTKKAKTNSKSKHKGKNCRSSMHACQTKHTTCDTPLPLPIGSHGFLSWLTISKSDKKMKKWHNITKGTFRIINRPYSPAKINVNTVSELENDLLRPSYAVVYVHVFEYSIYQYSYGKIYNKIAVNYLNIP